MLVDGLSFLLPRAGIVGVIGPNGAGKTTLFKMLIGQEKPDGGTLRIGETVELAYVDQIARRAPGRQERLGGDHRRQPGSGARQARGEQPRVLLVVQLQGLRSAEEGQGPLRRRANRVHLARLLKEGGNLILLDEPTNDLDVETLQALETALLGFPGCVVVVSHDRWFLDRIATHMLAFEGDGKVTFFDGNYQLYEEDRKKRLGDDGEKGPKGKFRKLGAM